MPNSQISPITNGTLIDQTLLSDIITNVNSIGNAQYNNTSSLAKGHSSSKSNLQNGQWTVSTAFVTGTMSIDGTSGIVTSTAGQVDFGTTFSELPIITGTVYIPTNTADKTLLDNLISTVVITEVTKTSFKWKVLASSRGTSGTNQSFSLMFTIVGIAPTTTA